MNLKRIFLKDACPTRIGGQAVLNGIMMKGEDRTAVVVRLPNKSMYVKTRRIKEPSIWSKIPIIRGVVAFVASMIEGTKMLMYSAEILETYGTETSAQGEEEEQDRLTAWLENKFGEEKAWNIMLYSSVIIAILLTVGIFVVLPTLAIHLLSKITPNPVVLNVAEGILRIAMFVLYVVAISQLGDIKTIFKFHGAEHKCIHCFENGEELTPENCHKYDTLHPRCGTSFLMFVLVISLVLFSILGWPDLFWRVASRLLLIPVIAGLSYELLRWAGRSDNWFVKILSLPGLYLQKLTTKEPDDDQLEVAIAAMKAVLVEANAPCIEGPCDKEGREIPYKPEKIKIDYDPGQFEVKI